MQLSAMNWACMSGRETRVLGGAETLCFEPPLRLHANTILQCRHSRASVAQLLDHGVKMVGPAVLEYHVATGSDNST